MSINPFETALDSDTLIDAIRSKLGIRNCIREMTDKEIRMVCRVVGLKTPGTTVENGQESFSRIGFETMISMALYTFPWYYEKWELSQHN